MMTKTEYAKCIVSDFCINNLHINDYTKIIDWSLYMTQSSCLAVALEFLGLLTKEQIEYSKTVSGVLNIHMDDDTGAVSILSVREVLDLLPN